MSRIIPKLGLHDINDGDLVTYTQDKIDRINGLAAFGGVVPTPGTLNAKKNQYQAALTASVQGNTSQTEAKNNRRAELEELLTQQAENCAEIADGDLPLYLSTGYAAKDTEGTPIGELGQVLNLKLKTTETIGELKADWDPVEKSTNYTVRCYTDEANPETSTIYSETESASKATIPGMPSGIRVYVQARANGGSTKHGPWSDSAWDRPR